MEAGKKFWLVLDEGLTILHKYESEIGAIGKCQCLAHINPGRDFFVLKATHVARIEPVGCIRRLD